MKFKIVAVTFVVISLLIPNTIAAKFIPGIGCGTLKAIQFLNRDPTSAEETEGCLYISTHVSSFKAPEGCISILGMAATLKRGLVNIFLKVLFACLGSRAAAVQLWKSKKMIFKKPLLQEAAIPSIDL